MFNRVGFNQAEFNTTSNTDVYLYGTLSGSAALTAEFNALFHISFTASGESSIQSVYHRLIEARTHLSADGTITAKVLRTLYFSRELFAESNIEAYPTHLRVETIEFMGDIKPGDVLVIDMQNLTCTVNGQNTLHLIDLSQFNLRPGENELTYEDEEGTRTLQINITHRDRWL